MAGLQEKSSKKKEEKIGPYTFKILDIQKVELVQRSGIIAQPGLLRLSYSPPVLELQQT